MPRAAPTPPVDPKMFRHFAVLTLAITALLAIFASGESQQALEQQVAEKHEKNELEKAELELAKKGKGGNTGLVFKENRKQKSTWGIDEGSPDTNYAYTDGEGSPELAGARGPQYIDLPSVEGTNSGRPGVAPPGMTAQAMKDLKKKKKKLAQKDPMGRRPPPTEEELADY